MKKIIILLFLAISTTSAFADTAIETETAQLGKQGDALISQSIEFVHGKDGSGGGTLTQFEYAITDRSEILIEPFFYLWEHPKGEKREDGVGDLEITPSYMVVQENGWVPAILLATKVKVPTGARNVGGTRKYDFYPYLIFGQHVGDWIFNANLGVNFARKIEGSGYDRTTVWDLEAEREVAPNLTAFFEVYSAEDHVKTVSTAFEYQISKRVNLFTAFSYNENHEVIVRPGLNFEF